MIIGQKINQSMEEFLENLKENGLHVLGCIAFVTIVIAFDGFGNPFMYWATILFFGVGGLALLFKPYLPTYTPPTSTYNPSIHERTDLGIFDFGKPELFSIYSYSESGVEFFCCWAHIETLIGYIDDERIALQIYVKDKSHILLQNFTPGWYRFHTELHLHFPSVSPTWFEQQQGKPLEILYYMTEKTELKHK
jgi:hypothetical protein